MRMIILVCLCFALAGCGVRVSKTSQSTANAAVMDLTYALDPTTHQSYAVVSTAHALSFSDMGATITYVPCTPEVMKKISS